MPAWSPNDQEITFVSADAAERGARAMRRRDCGRSSADGRERLHPDRTSNDDRHAVGGRVETRTARKLAYSRGAARLCIAGGTRERSDGHRRAGRLSVQAAVAVRHRGALHGERPHLATVERSDGALTPPSRCRSRAKVSLQRSTYTIAHRALEPAEPQKLTGIVSPVVSPDGRAIAFMAMGDLWVLPVGGQPVQITNDRGGRDRSGLVARQRAARVRAAIAAVTWICGSTICAPTASRS